MYFARRGIFLIRVQQHTLLSGVKSSATLVAREPWRRYVSAFGGIQRFGYAGGMKKNASLEAFTRRIKKLAHQADIRDAIKRGRRGEPLPGDDELIREGAIRSVKLVVARHLREERKYAKQPPEERIRYDIEEKQFYRERREVIGYERKRSLARNYIEPSYEPEYLHAMTQAVREFETEEEATQRIIDFFNEEPDTVKAAMSALGAVGGRVKSEAKARAARKNGARGGRPKKSHSR